MRRNKNYQIICFGEMLWDVLPLGKMPGGAPMNVAYHLDRLGVPTSMIGRVGEDELGDELLQFVREKKIPTGFVQIDSDYPTGEVLAHVSKNEVTYDILKPAAWDFIEWQDKFVELFQKARYFVFGSLAARSKISRNTLYQLLEVAHAKVFDINLRPPHFEKNVAEALLQSTDILKLNGDELKLIISWYGNYPKEKDAMQFLQNKFDIRTVITTKGEEGASVLQEGNLYQQPAFRVKVKNTIGSGDAFLAGYLYKTLNQASMEETLSFACALGALVATHEGACPDYSIKDIEKLNISRDT